MHSVVLASVSRSAAVIEFAAVLTVAAGLALVLHRLLHWRRDIAQRRAVVLAARDRMMRIQAKVQRIHLLAKRLPLAALLDFSLDPDQHVAAAARAALRTRPALETELAAMLASDDRVRALKFLWLRGEKPPAGLAEAFHACLHSLPQWVDRRFAASGLSRTTEFEWACRSLPRLSARFAASGLDFSAPVADLVAHLQAHYGADALPFLSLLEEMVPAAMPKRPRLETTLWGKARGPSLRVKVPAEPSRDTRPIFAAVMAH